MEGKGKKLLVLPEKEYYEELEELYEFRCEQDAIIQGRLKSEVKQAEIKLEEAKKNLAEFKFTTKKEYFEQYNYQDWLKKNKEHAEKEGMILTIAKRDE